MNMCLHINSSIIELIKINIGTEWKAAFNTRAINVLNIDTRRQNYTKL